MFYGTLNRFPTVGKCFLNIFWAITAVLCKSGNHYNKLHGEPCADMPGALGLISPWSLLLPVLSHSGSCRRTCHSSRAFPVGGKSLG